MNIKINLRLRWAISYPSLYKLSGLLTGDKLSPRLDAKFKMDEIEKSVHVFVILNKLVSKRVTQKYVT